MNNDHDRVQRAIAGYALHALDDEEMIEFERILESHVPHCLECRAALEDFQRIAGDLGLAAGSRRPPGTLGAKLRRELRPTRRLAVPRLAGAVAVVAALATMAVWAVHLDTRVSQAEDRQARTTEVLATVSHPLSHVVPLSAEQGAAPRTQVAATFIPGRAALYLFGFMPNPQADRVYQVWLMRSGTFASAGTFVPKNGQVLVRIGVDPSPYDSLLITEEPSTGSPAPSEQHVVTASL